MVFSSPVFIFYFLPLVIAAYFLAIFASRGRCGAGNIVLLLFSLFFYTYGSGKHVLTLIAIFASSYVAGACIKTTTHRKLSAVLGILVPMAILAVFKYANFATGELRSLSILLGLPKVPVTDYVLPIGISFYTFQSVSYVIDVYRGRCEAFESYTDLLLYICMFPQLIAGPIVRFHEVSAQIGRRKTTLDDFALGSSRFVFGLAKKIVVADAMGFVADAAFGLDPSRLTTPAACIGALAYTFQIYFDFSAYSDMAIGLGRIFGFRFPENFRRPYSAQSMTDFWRRWHMTLSAWFRDYVYIPLGGSRKGTLRTALNLWIVFVTVGIWHGANWTFLVWGVYHGLLLSLERLLGLRGHDRHRAAWRAATFALVAIGWVFFRADSLASAWAFLQHIFVPTDWTMPHQVLVTLTKRNIIIGVLACATLLLPGDYVTGRLVEEGPPDKRFTARAVATAAAMALISLGIASSNFSPFIYFQF